MNISPRLQLGLVLLLACLLRLGGATYWQQAAEAEGRLFRLGDSHSYWTLASQISQGLPYQYGSPDASVFRAPLYPLWLAPWTTLADERLGVWVARLLGCGLGTLAVGLIYALAGRLAGPTAACWAGVLAAVYPAAIGMSIVILSEAIFLPLMVAHLLLWQTAWRAPGRRQLFLWATLAGGVAGAAVLSRPSWLLFAPFVCGVGVLLGPRRPRHVAIFAGSLLGMCVVMSPWWVRNAQITGQFVLTTLQVGPSLYDGLHAGATGASDEGMAFMQQFVEEQRRADAQAMEPLQSTLEYRVNRRAQQAAVEWAMGHPVEVLRLAGQKFLRTWSLWPDGGEVGSWGIRLIMTLSTGGVLLLATYASLRLLRPWEWFWGICWLPCLYFTLLHMVFVGSVRYREPAMFALVGLAGCAMVALLHGPWRRQVAAKPVERFLGSASIPHK